MLIPSTTSIRVEDFPKEEQSWLPRLLGPLNSFLLSTITAINGNMTFGDNIPCQTFKLSFTSVGTSDFPKQVKWTVSSNQLGAAVSPPVEVRVCSASENGVGIAVQIAWSYANGQITFPYIVKMTSTGVVGLTVGAVYKIVLRGQL